MNLDAQKLSIDNSDFFYQIAPIFDFKQSIVSLTFDDGYISQFEIGIPLLKERNLSATFYVITNSVDSLIKTIILGNKSDEFEIGSHTMTHPDLVKIGNEEAIKELLDSQLYLKNKFGEYAGLTLSYPWGIYNNSIKQLAESYYLAARSADVGYNSLVMLDKYALKMQSFDEHTEVFKADQWVDFSIKNHLWLIEMIHGIDNNGYSPVDSRTLIEHFDYIKKNEDNIWCTTVGTAVKYVDESRIAKVFCGDCNYYSRPKCLLNIGLNSKNNR